MARGYQRRQKQLEAQELDAWHRLRLLGTTIVNVNREPGTEPMTVEEYLKLPGDVAPPPAPVLSPAEIKEATARINTLDADLL